MKSKLKIIHDVRPQKKVLDREFFASVYKKHGLSQDEAIALAHMFAGIRPERGKFSDERLHVIANAAEEIAGELLSNHTITATRH